MENIGKFIDGLSGLEFTTLLVWTFVFIYLILLVAKERKEYLKAKQFYEVQKRLKEEAEDFNAHNQY